MPATFGKSTDKYFRIVVLILAIGAAGTLGLVGYLAQPVVKNTGYAPLQPVEYSHKLHAGDLGMDCRYCHYTVERSGYAAVPQTEVCMNCHVRVKENSELLLPVRDSYATGEPIPWIKVHRLPDYVFFNHQAHVTAGVSCASCHGRVDQMITVKQVEPLSMAWCLDCHRNPEASVRPVEEVTNLGWQPDRDPAEIGAELIEMKGIKPPTNCSGCHR
jgi:hypothetical protein